MQRLARLSLASMIAVFLLIAIGATVRATGAGLGCPDWPHCYGRWIPPTDVSQLRPTDDASRFNARKTWTEYLNRLAGVATGLLVLGTTVRAWRHRKEAHGLFAPALTALVLTALQGLIGAVVVRLELDPRWVTLHFLVALVIVERLIVLVLRCRRDSGSGSSGRTAGLTPANRRLLGVVFGIVAFQVLLGCLVRGGIEIVAAGADEAPRGEWLSRVGLPDLLHRLGAATSLLALIFLGLRLRREAGLRPAILRAYGLVLGLVILQYAAGVGLYEWALPPVLQVLHVSMGSLVMGALIFLHRLQSSRI